MVARQLVQLVSSSSPLIGQCAAAILAKACQVREKALGDGGVRALGFRVGVGNFPNQLFGFAYSLLIV